MEVGLFTGQIEPHVDLRPLRRVIQFDRFLPEVEPVIMEVCADANREVHFALKTKGQGASVTPVTTIALRVDDPDTIKDTNPLPDVNPQSRQ